MGLDYSFLCLKQEGEKLYVSQKTALKADKKGVETETKPIAVQNKTVYLQVKVKAGGICTFFYSEDGKKFIAVGENFTAKEGKWIGAKVGLLALRQGIINDAGSAAIDWFRITK
jgi:beta-xylosidase